MSHHGYSLHCGRFSMGSRPMYIETVLTCEGNFYAPNFSNQLSMFCKKFESLITNDKQPLFYVKVEPWNSVRVWLQLPAEASERLKALANEQAAMLRDLGVLTVHIKEENSVVSFNLQSENTADSCSSAVSQDSAGSSVNLVNSLISLDSHYCRSQEVSEESQELNILTSPMSDFCRNGYKKSTLSILADREICCNSEACAELDQLSFHRKTAAETLESNGKMLASRTAESGCTISETGPSAFKSMTNRHSVASHATTLNGFHNRHLNDPHRLSEVQSRVGRQQENKSYKQKSVKASPPDEQFFCDSPTLDEGGCLLQSHVTMSSDSVTVAKTGISMTLVEGCEHTSIFPSNSGRLSRKRKSDDFDGDARPSVLPPVLDDCQHHSTGYNGSVTNYNGSVTDYNGSVANYNGSVANYNGSVTNYNGSVTDYNGSVTNYNGSVTGGCSTTESGTSVSFQSLPQHSTSVRCIINPFTGEMENVPADDVDDDLVMSHGAESSAVPNHACHSTSPAAVGDGPTFGGFTISSGGHSVSFDADHLVSVNNFLQSILARLEVSSSADSHLLNLLNSVVDNAMASQLLTESVAETERSIMSLLSPQIQAPHLNGIGHSVIHDDHAKRPSSISSVVGSTVGNGKHELGRVRERQKLFTDSDITCNGVLNVSGFHSANEVLQLQHSTEIASEIASSQARYLMQQGAFGTVASLPSNLHQIEDEGCDSGIAVSHANAGGLKFQEDVHADLGNMVVQVGTAASAKCQNVSKGMLMTTASQQDGGRNLQHAQYQSQSQQVKDISKHASHECLKVTDFLSRNVVNDDACNQLLISRASSRTAASTNSVDQLQRLFGASEKTAFSMYTYCNTNGLSQNRELSEQINSVASGGSQHGAIARTDAISSGKRLIMRSNNGKEGTSDSSMDPVSEVGHYRLADSNLQNGSLHHIPQTETSILGRDTLSASVKTAESPQPSSRKCPVKKSKSCDRSKRAASSVVGKSSSQTSSSNNFVLGRQAKPLTKSQPTVAQLLDEARAKQAVSAGAQLTLANSATVSPFLEAHAIGAWQKQMSNVALINLLPYSQPLSDFQCSALEMLPLSLPRSSPSVPSLIAVPLSSIGLAEPESVLQSGASVLQGDSSHHQHLSAFVFEHCQGLVQPSGIDLLNSMDVKQEMLESGASTDSVSVKIESTSHSGSPGIDDIQATAVASCCDAKDSTISAATFTVKQEL